MLAALGLVLFAFTACTIRIHEDEDDDDDWGWHDQDDADADDADADDVGADSPSGDAQEACEPYCFKLVQCSVISDASLRSCISLCASRFEKEGKDVAEASECVSEASCGSDAIAECEGDPIPGVWSDGDQGLALDTAS